MNEIPTTEYMLTVRRRFNAIDPVQAREMVRRHLVEMGILDSVDQPIPTDGISFEIKLQELKKNAPAVGIQM